MTNTIKVTDTSVEKAIQKGLRQLGLTKEEVVVEVLSEGKKGLFGFGQKDAIVALTPVVKEEVVEEVSTPVVEETIEEVVAAEDESFEEEFEDEFEDEEDVEGSENEETTVDRLEEAAHVTKAYLEGIAKTYGAEATVAVEVRRDRMTFVFDTDKQGLLPCFPIKRPCLSVSNTKVMRSRRASTVTVAWAPYVFAMPSKYSFVTRAASSNWSTVSS